MTHCGEERVERRRRAARGGPKGAEQVEEECLLTAHVKATDVSVGTLHVGEDRLWRGLACQSRALESDKARAEKRREGEAKHRKLHALAWSPIDLDEDELVSSRRRGRLGGQSREAWKKAEVAQNSRDCMQNEGEIAEMAASMAILLVKSVFGSVLAPWSVWWVAPLMTPDRIHEAVQEIWVSCAESEVQLSPRSSPTSLRLG